MLISFFKKDEQKGNKLRRKEKKKRTNFKKKKYIKTDGLGHVVSLLSYFKVFRKISKKKKKNRRKNIVHPKQFSLKTIELMNISLKR